jgi:hypothetical protein
MWSYHVETYRWPSGWNISTHGFELSTWESVARRGVCSAGANIAGAGHAAGDAGEVATAGADDDGEVGKSGVGVASCGRGGIPEENFASTATRDENGMYSVLCQGIVSTMH